ncbi:MAG: C1 family peptidase [Myxococcales bacterium]
MFRFGARLVVAGWSVGALLSCSNSSPVSADGQDGGLPDPPVNDVPSMDWRTRNAVIPPPDQGQCGSGWAFAAVGALEGAWSVKTGTLVPFSVSQMVDCAGTSDGGDGCGGSDNAGVFEVAYTYAKNQGLRAASCYPYKPSVGVCRSSQCAEIAGPQSWRKIPSGDESALLREVATHGPIAARIDSSQYSFQFYSSGVYDERSCSSEELDHAVLVVGYDHDPKSNKDYWIVRNSWGGSWGNKGYMWMVRNKGNQCGIATDAWIPEF